ncbi:MAG: hypothetical protein K0S49_1376 [Microbacterium sp.]|nr:hypothetical protein [Microbacterium sp.]
MPGIAVRMEGLDLAALDDVLERTRAALGRLDALALGDLDPAKMLDGLDDVVGGLTAGMPSADELAQLASTALEELTGLLGLPDIPGLGDAAEAVRALTDRLGGLAALRPGEGGVTVDSLLASLGGTFDLAGIVDEIAARAAGVLDVGLPDELAATAKALSRLASDDIDPGALPGIIADVLFGIDLDVARRFAEGSAALESAIAEAGDFDATAAAIVAATAEIEAAMQVALQFDSSRNVDLLVAATTRVTASLDVVDVSFRAFMGGVDRGLSLAGELAAKFDVGADLERLSGVLALPTPDLIGELVSSLKALQAQLEGADAAAVLAAAATMPDRLGLTTLAAELESAFAVIDEAFDEVVGLIRRLPLRRARDTVVDALSSAQAKIMSFRGFAFLSAVTQPIDALAAWIRGLDAAAVTASITEALADVRAAIEAVPAAELRDTVDAVVAPVQEALGGFGPKIERVVREANALTETLGRIEVEAAATLTVDNIRELRTSLGDAIGSGAVPEPVRAAIGTAAAALQDVDISTTLGSLSVTLDGSVLAAPLAEVREGISQVRDTLAGVSPGALTADLDGPFRSALDALDALSLEPFTAAVSARLGEVKGVVRSVDPRLLLAPLEESFQSALDGVRATVDPTPLIAPLQDAYDSLREIVSGLDVEAALTGLLGTIAEIPDTLTAAITRRAGAAGTTGATAAPIATEFAFGDVLRPIAALIAEIRGRVVALAGPALGEVLAVLASIVRSLRRALDPDTGAVATVAAQLRARLELADPTAATGPLADLRASVTAFVGTARALQIGPGTMKVRAALNGVRVEVVTGEGPDASARAERLLARIDTVAARAAAPRLVAFMDTSLPPALLDETRDPQAAVDEFVAELFAPLDPTAAADELDAIGIAVRAKLESLAEALASGLTRVAAALFGAFDPIRPERILARIQAGIDRVTGELEVLDPSVIGRELTGVVDATLGLASMHSPGAWARRLGTVFDAVLAQLDALDPAALLGGADPVAAARAELEALRPSVVLAPLAEAAASISGALDAVERLDLSGLAEATASLSVDVDGVLAGVAEEWTALLDDLATAGASVEVSAGTP